MNGGFLPYGARDHEVLDLAIEALAELQTVQRVVADVIGRAREILAKAEDVAIQGDVIMDAVSPGTRQALRDAQAAIASFEQKNGIERRTGMLQ